MDVPRAPSAGREMNCILWADGWSSLSLHTSDPCSYQWLKRSLINAKNTLSALSHCFSINSIYLIRINSQFINYWQSKLYWGVTRIIGTNTWMLSLASQHKLNYSYCLCTLNSFIDLFSLFIYPSFNSNTYSKCFAILYYPQFRQIKTKSTPNWQLRGGHYMHNVNFVFRARLKLLNFHPVLGYGIQTAH